MGLLSGMSPQAASSQMRAILECISESSSEKGEPHAVVLGLYDRRGLCMDACRFNTVIVKFDG
jgi:hypothetical protein